MSLGDASVGVLVPSSNTVMEPALASIAAQRRDGIRLLHARVPVVAIDAEHDRQFAVEPMLAAARLLADASPRGIVWGGTSGGWMGLDADRAIVDAVAEATGLPMTTTTMATVARLRGLGARSVGFATPYTPDVCRRIADTYTGLGFARVEIEGLGLSRNTDFAAVGEERVLEQAERLLARGCDAVVVYCTNVAALGVIGPLEARGVAVVDSVAVTYAAIAELAGRPVADDSLGRRGSTGPREGGADAAAAASETAPQQDHERTAPS